ncbi:hypothetical protein PBNK65E_000164900 [Plasmodium berghei]|uniref:Plasmodium variant antigen protein Cir/Yir/Bir n=2 Tax=Plasmodium berghei TaxID=5821 RepID=A0A509AIZ2_PLABA|nr:conserved Plasmodium protein, unknown function [Plasmodium berghei ANKA]CXI35597.1 hypothetical protein PBK173_000172000 [Plasmodium berghei]SCM21522.1 hypothetical protein PBNK65NY_000164100 [Plasmodium berghei]SCN24721.1 hypothetical protein PBNK65E_000164900 [Plasmodium berghei]SCO59864.1 hypothetical protein PBSP11RLL_000164200 [Plasmodium berghei]SCO61176.1 hypothetical protein PBSP11A_000164100 [Plasmodium berghei]|eukprot:XP_034421262.1 conserved Plasmodium protein, unknown function [Plasmodium berghei ANKA]
MGNKEALFYNSVNDPYVVNYMWLYGNNINKSEIERNKNMQLKSSRCIYNSRNNNGPSYCVEIGKKKNQDLNHKREDI